MQANPGKALTIAVDGVTYSRIPLRTDVILPTHDILDVVKKAILDRKKEGDYLFLSERVVAITQGRAHKMTEITPRPLAHFLASKVHKSPYGIGLSISETMELAIQEVGVLRILLAAAVAAVTRPFGWKGWFYRIAGRAAASIDGPCDYTLPPYNAYATLGPKNPNRVARLIKDAIGLDVVIIDANDLGVDILGRSDKSIQKKWAEKMFKDNPLGQSNEQTPLALVRRES